MLVLKRPPGDTFTFRLFYKLAVSQPQYDAIYVWSTALEPSYLNLHKQHFNGIAFEDETELHIRSVIQNNIKKDNIILAVKDHLTTTDFNPWTENMPPTAEYLNQFIKFYKDKTIILLTSVENLDYYIKEPNVRIVPWGGDITNHQNEYKLLNANESKNFDSTYTYLSLNRNARNHRKILLSMLCGLDLESRGLISCMFESEMYNCQDILKETKWQFRDNQQHVKEIITKGFDRFKNFTPSIKDNRNIYTDGKNDNVSNFKNKLFKYYQNTFVEIISETSFTERCYLLTEKTLNSIYGLNFPILLSGQGAVKLLRNMGMDMFDDVIDHSYDQCENPIDRLYLALERNTKVLTNIEYVKQKWKECEPRFKKNVEWAKTTLYNYYEERTAELFQNVVKSPHIK
jgi:hypothetical protein